MKHPLEIRFQGMASAEMATMEPKLRARAAALGDCAPLIACSVAVERLPHRNNPPGEPYVVRIDARFRDHDFTVARVSVDGADAAMQNAFDSIGSHLRASQAAA